MKKTIVLSIFVMLSICVSAQSGSGISCSSEHFTFHIDTSKEYNVFTINNVLFNPLDTLIKYPQSTKLDFLSVMCNDTLFITLSKQDYAALHISEYWVDYMKYKDGIWQNGRSFILPFDMAGHSMGVPSPNVTITETLDAKLLAIDEVQYRVETVVCCDTSSKQVWEYIDKLDYNTGKKVTISSIRIE